MVFTFAVIDVASGGTVSLAAGSVEALQRRNWLQKRLLQQLVDPCIAAGGHYHGPQCHIPGSDPAAAIQDIPLLFGD